MSRLVTLSIVVGCGLAIQGGCYKSARESARTSRKTADSTAAMTSVKSEGLDEKSSGSALALADKSSSMPTTLAGRESVTATAPISSDRKIIYVADVTIVVQDFAKIEKELPSLVSSSGGYLADVSIDRSRGERRSGRWVARVPVDRFEAFLDGLSGLGVPEGRHQTAQDVSEEYVDLEARIKNGKRLEDRILKLIDERTGNIKDVTDAEQQLSRVREEIERMEGRLRYLANRTSLTTVTISAREEKDFKPPETPAFSARIGHGWSNSLASLQDSTEDFLVGAIAAAPWICVWAIILSPLVWFVRRQFKRWMATPPFNS